MDLDSEDPPELVEVENVHVSPAAPFGVASGLQDLTLSKVPLTLVTEFGDSVDIEKSLTVAQDGQEVQEWLELGNGCICCSIKDSGVNAIESLMDRRGAFDYIILETSGLAEPGNLAPLFWVDEGLGSSIYLDGIVTMVDAKNILFSLDETPASDISRQLEYGEIEQKHDGPHETTAHLQISHADVVIINKCDSVSSDQLIQVEDRVRSINGLAKIEKTAYGKVPQLEGVLLDLHAYDGVGSLDTSRHGHSHLDPTISTITLAFPAIVGSRLPALESWLRSVLWESTIPFDGSLVNASAPTFSVHRTKGRIITTNPDGVKMVQGVRDVFEMVDLDRTDKSVHGTAGSKLVLIGRGLDQMTFAQSLHSRVLLG